MSAVKALLVVTSFLCLLNACGQTGRLYLAPKVSEAHPMPQPDEEIDNAAPNSQLR